MRSEELRVRSLELGVNITCYLLLITYFQRAVDRLGTIMFVMRNKNKKTSYPRLLIPNP